MGILPACNVAMREASLSVATTSCPASARQLPETSPTYPHPITASFTRHFSLQRTYILTILIKMCTNSFSPNGSTPGERKDVVIAQGLRYSGGLQVKPAPVRTS